MTMFSRAARREAITSAFAGPAAVAATLGEVTVPDDLAAWLGRLLTLAGVPFGYLVPDEAMLPPESIRFFRLDEQWVTALLDGAFSLGRNLTAQAGGASASLDGALLGPVAASARAAAPLRPRAEVAPPGPADAGAPWTGFLLRSRIVTDYPGLGVNVYPAGATPADPQPALLPVRRLDRLGPRGDTLLCLVHGEAYRVDVHQAPELLHYGIDDYAPPAAAGQGPSAGKKLRTFRRAADGSVTFGPGTVDVAIGASFRPRSPRVLRLADLATALAAANGGGPVDSADMGFAMTEGVGMVSFVSRGAS
ncbi:MAG TPA: hypothetical protein VH478_13515 [Trebonia sp.]|jgi:hypothetical protein|nr:hypothetical protein [Trebonia sp.]